MLLKEQLEAERRDAVKRGQLLSMLGPKSEENQAKVDFMFEMALGRNSQYGLVMHSFEQSFSYIIVRGDCSKNTAKNNYSATNLVRKRARAPRGKTSIKYTFRNIESKK